MELFLKLKFLKPLKNLAQQLTEIQSDPRYRTGIIARLGVNSMPANPAKVLNPKKATTPFP